MGNVVVRISSPYSFSWSEDGAIRTLRIWEEAAAYFSKPHSQIAFFDWFPAPGATFEIEIDTRPMVKFLRAARGMDGGTEINGFDDLWYMDKNVSLRPKIGIAWKQIAGSDFLGIPFSLDRMLQQLFLAINIAEPGACDFSTCEYAGREEFSNAPTKLDASLFFEAYNLEDWPALSGLPFDQVWRWLHEDMFYDLYVAKTPFQKALFALLMLCTRDVFDPQNSVLIAQALEGLFIAKKGEPIESTVRDRIRDVLGNPPLRQNWFKKFYDIRSGLVHGGADSVRPGAYLSKDPEGTKLVGKIAELNLRGTAVLLAVLQDLVKRREHRYVFPPRTVQASDPPA